MTKIPNKTLLFIVKEWLKKFFYFFYFLERKIEKVIMLLLVLFIIVNISKAIVGCFISGSSTALISFGAHFLGMVCGYFSFKKDSLYVVLLFIFTLNLLYFIGIEAYIAEGGGVEIREILAFVFSSADCVGSEPVINTGESAAPPINTAAVPAAPPINTVAVPTANPGILNTALAISGSASIAVNTFFAIPGLLNKGISVGSSLSQDAKDGIVVVREAIDVAKEGLEVGKEISNQLRIINSSGISETTWGIGCLVSATVASNNYTRLPKFTI